VWLMLELAEVIAVDARQRGTVLNRRAKALPKLHEQYQTIASRFAKRCEALQLEKGRLGSSAPANARKRRAKTMKYVRVGFSGTIRSHDRLRASPGQRHREVLKGEVR
jgi:hypothetical protein